jgi:transposase
MGRAITTTAHQPRVKRLLEMGRSTREIAKSMSMSKSTVARLAKSMQGEHVQTNKGGRPPLLSSRQRSLLIRGIIKHSYTLATEASAYWLQHYKLRLSRQTITRVLKQGKLKLRVRRKKPLLTKRHKQRRLAFAKRYQYWTVEQWKNVIWSDECKVQQLGKNPNRRYWSRLLNLDMYTPTVQGGCHSVMIWGCMTWTGLGLMVAIDGNLNSESYIDLLEEALPGSILKWKQKQVLPPRDVMIFQQDNASCHSSRATQEYLREVQLNVLPWPVMSPDLNPIEHVWAQLKKRLSYQRFTIKTKQDLKAAIAHIWEQFPPEAVQTLISSMPSRLEAVRKARGGHTKY